MDYKILCCADTHGGTPPVADETGVLAWLHAGDVTDGPSALGDGSDPDADPLRAPAAAWFRTRSVPVLLTRGNHDIADDLRAFRRCTDLTARVVSVAPGLFVAGVGWSGERYFELPREVDLEPVCQAARRQALRVVMPGDSLILLTHYPPRVPEARVVDPDPDNGGYWYRAVRQLVDDLTPVVVIEGHVHRWSRTSYTVPIAGRMTTVVNPGAEGARLTLDLAAGSVGVEWL